MESFSYQADHSTLPVALTTVQAWEGGVMFTIDGSEFSPDSHCE